ncbi:MAG: CAP domain-containing protein [Actinomycetota bacterium]
MPRLLQSTVVTLTAALFVGAGSVAGAGTGSCYTYSNKDRALAQKTNRARSNRDIAKLSLDPQISHVAKRHSRAMASKNTLYHTASLGSLVTRWKSLGENVGYAGSVKSVHRAYMNSAGHKANILKPGYRNFGVGVVKKGGRVWTTVVFEARKNPGTTLKMPSC